MRQTRLLRLAVGSSTSRFRRHLGARLHQYYVRAISRVATTEPPTTDDTMQQETTDPTADDDDDDDDDDDAMQEPLTDAADVQLAQRDRPSAPVLTAAGTPVPVTEPAELSPSGVRDLKEKEEARNARRAALLVKSTVERPSDVLNPIAEDQDMDKLERNAALLEDL
jgi:hypothetical protein